MKRTLLIFPALLLSIFTKAQNLQDAITKTDNERFESAASDFRALIGKDPTKGDYYFYAGENYFKNNVLDSALMMYQKGIEVQATNPLNHIGMGKVLLYQNKENDGNAELFKGKTLGAKNANALMELAEVYITVPAPYKNLIDASKLLSDAMKLEPKNPEPHILMGDDLLEQNPTDGSPAIKEYNKALELNPKSPKAILRRGKLYYRGRNWTDALKEYKQALEIDPNFAPAWLEIAEIYHQIGQESKALEAIKKYLELNQNSLYARKRYASFLFTNKKYAEAIKEIEEIVKLAPKDPYMWRLLGYSYFELGDKPDKDAYQKGLDAINKFFELSSGGTFKYIADDYKYKGRLLSKTGKDSLGILEIVKAIALDSVKNCELNGEIGKIAAKGKKWDKAIYYYEKKALCTKGLDGQDYFDLGRSYYYLGGAKQKEKKDEEAMAFFVKADSAFSKVCQANPMFPTGYFFRGRANLQLDPKMEKLSAKPHFEKALSLIKPEERSLPTNKSSVIEACEYLGYVYCKSKDTEKAKEYWNIVKELDPTNKKVIDFFKNPSCK